MVNALHIDGLILFLVSMGMVMLAQDYRRWRFRIPLFSMAFCYFSLSIILLGIYRPLVSPYWIWLRVGGDSSLGVLVWFYYQARRSHSPAVTVEVNFE